MTRGRLADAEKLTKALATAGRRHRAKLISGWNDEDLLFWVGCVLLNSGTRDAAAECYSAAMAKGHTVAALSLFDLTLSAVPDDDHAGADVQSITDRFAEAVKTECVENITTLVLSENKPGEIRPEDELDVLVGAAVSGEPSALDSLLRRINPLVVRYCRARLGRQERTFASADDVAQEVSLAVITALPHYRDQERPFLAFVYGIAAHKVADAHRAAARNKSDPVDEVPDELVHADGPEQRVLQSELAGRMGRLLDILPDRQREILTLRLAVGLTAEETAKAVGMTSGAVLVAQRRALNRLRKVLASEEVV